MSTSSAACGRSTCTSRSCAATATGRGCARRCATTAMRSRSSPAQASFPATCCSRTSASPGTTASCSTTTTRSRPSPTWSFGAYRRRATTQTRSRRSLTGRSARATCFRSSSSPSWWATRARARCSTSTTATCSIHLFGWASRSACALACRTTSFLTPRKSAFLGHRPVLREIEPALDDAVDNPDRVGRENEPADDQDKQDRTGHCPQQPEPERADLPAEVRFEPLAGDVLTLHVVDDHRDDPDDGRQEESRGLQRVDQHGERLQPVGGFHSFTPSMTTRLRRDLSPEAMRTLRRGT